MVTIIVHRNKIILASLALTLAGLVAVRLIDALTGQVRMKVWEVRGDE